MIFSLISPPLIGFLFNSLRFKSRNKKLSGITAVSACALSFLACVFYILRFGFEHKSFFVLPWFQIGDLSLNFSFTLDSLSLLMCLLITGVGTLIHLYSLAYMSEDEGQTRYFSYLNLFIFMMLILVLADSLPLLFIGWEGVGLCSYLLIGFWFKEKQKVGAGMTAFIVNRIGDAFFLLGIFFLFLHFGTVQFSELNALFKSGLPKESLGISGVLFIFLGATGKSAQFPLYFWLSEAMAGPTPVSALIHAATMVTAGVYLFVRMSFVYMAFPQILLLIAWVGALTALGSALIACRQWDFKKILAYSTVSQLAYLFMAVGVGAFSSSIFHLLTHGFFKALLFLCAGSVIHSLSGEQDIRKMGGLRKSMPITFFCYLSGALALTAIPPFSGFFSKDEILWSLFAGKSYGLYLLAFLTGLLTCFYMTRLTVFVFFGKAKAKAHENNWLMTTPLIVLALFSLFSGALGLPHLFSDLLPGHPPHILQKLLQSFSPWSFKGSKLMEASLMLLSTVDGLIVIGLTGFYYLKTQTAKQTFWGTLLERAFYIPQLTRTYIPHLFAQSCFQIFKRIELGFFNHLPLFLSSQILKLKEQFAALQNGNLQSYALYLVMGLTVFVFLIFLK